MTTTPTPDGREQFREAVRRMFSDEPTPMEQTLQKLHEQAKAERSTPTIPDDNNNH